MFEVLLVSIDVFREIFSNSFDKYEKTDGYVYIYIFWKCQNSLNHVWPSSKYKENVKKSIWNVLNIIMCQAYIKKYDPHLAFSQKGARKRPPPPGKNPLSVPAIVSNLN